MVRIFALAVLLLGAGCNAGSEEAAQPQKPAHTAPTLRAIAFEDAGSVWIDPAGARGPIRVDEGSAPVISPDGRYLAYLQPKLNADIPLKVVHTDLLAAPLTLGFNAYERTWARDAPVLAAFGKGDVTVWNLATDRKVVVKPGAHIVRVSLSPNGSTLALELADKQTGAGKGIWLATVDGTGTPEPSLFIDDPDVYGPLLTDRGLVVSRAGALWLVDSDGNLGQKIAPLRTIFPDQLVGSGTAVDIADDDRSLLVFTDCAHGCSRTAIIDLDTGMRKFFEYGAGSGISRDGSQALVQEQCDTGLALLDAFPLVSVDAETGDRNTTEVDTPDACGSSWSY